MVVTTLSVVDICLVTPEHIRAGGQGDSNNELCVVMTAPSSRHKALYCSRHGLDNERRALEPQGESILPFWGCPIRSGHHRLQALLCRRE